MTVHIAPLPDQPPPAPAAGLGALITDRGNLPLDSVDVHAVITGLIAGITVTQGFRNPFDTPLEATYVFPLPDRAAVTALRMEAADRVIEGVLKERSQARQDYDEAIRAGHRAAIAEEDRPDVFTMRVGNILPGERVTVRLTLDQPLPYEDGAATFRFPLVVAPRYIPGAPLVDAQAGSGVAPDTDAVPDASRISPPVLLPGFPNPVALSLSVDLDPAGLPLTEIRSSLHVLTTSEAADRTTLRLAPGERLNRDFILRLGFATEESATLSLTPDASGAEGTFTLTVLPPARHPAATDPAATDPAATDPAATDMLPKPGQARSRPRDVVLVLDRSGSMAGWKIVAARRAAARMIDTLTGTDRFAVLSFDHEVCAPRDLPEGLVSGTDRHRFRAVQHLAGLTARGGTEMLSPLQRAAALLAEPGRDRVLVLITDGQIGNEDQILRTLEPALTGLRVHTVGIDRAVNAGFLNRLAAAGQGHAEFVESEDRLDEAMERIHHRIAAPLVTGLTLSAEELDLIADTATPARLGALFPGVPLVVAGRWRGGTARGSIAVSGVAPDGTAWQRRAVGAVAGNPAATTVWARAHLRELEDRYAVQGSADLEKQIVDISLRFGVLCRFTAFVAVDHRAVTSGDVPHQVIQPVELPDGWAAPAGPVPLVAAGPMARMASRPLRGVMSALDQSAGQPTGHTASAQHTAHPPIVESTVESGTPQPPAPGTSRSEVFAVARRRLIPELETLKASADAPQDSRRRLLTEFSGRLDALLTELRAAGAADEALTGLIDLLAELTAGLGADGPRDFPDLWDRTIRALTAATRRAQPRAFWKRRS